MDQQAPRAHIRRLLVVGVLTVSLGGAIASAYATTGGTAATSGVDLRRLPLGDGRLSTEPRKGHVWACQTSFRGAAAHGGPWIDHAARTYDLTAKPAVDGRVDWPSRLTITKRGSQRVITGNDLPKHATGTFPIAPTDDVYRYDRNPNAIRSQSLELTLAANPTIAREASCVPQGPIGVLTSGAYLFNALDAAGNDGVANEIQDECGGHPQQRGAYHYHGLSGCLDLGDPDGTSPLLGYALDGFGIYGPYQNGKLLTSADLDACHGTTSTVVWNGKKRKVYHYVLTYDYPYSIGCFRGTPAVGIGGPR